MSTPRAPICLGCSHYRQKLTCDAFPAGIPDAILASDVDHRRPVEGDRGITFAPRDEAAAAHAASVFEDDRGA